MPQTIDIDTVTKALADSIIAEVNTLIVGANEDIQAFANSIAADTVSAAALGRTDLLEELAGQTTMLLEKNRIKAAAGAEQVVLETVRILAGLAIKIVIPAIPLV